MDLRPVRDAHSCLAEQYIAMTTDGWHEHDDDTALVRQHLVGLAGFRRLLRDDGGYAAIAARAS